MLALKVVKFMGEFYIIELQNQNQNSASLIYLKNSCKCLWSKEVRDDSIWIICKSKPPGCCGFNGGSKGKAEFQGKQTQKAGITYLFPFLYLILFANSICIQDWESFAKIYESLRTSSVLAIVGTR